ncbi:hypothetical protein [Nocardia tengchongensis]|uniref:hypothetical protein n=1 Tax=Nocardia tengchongensis TaxID=2055889 RepID=UPI0036909D4B
MEPEALRRRARLSQAGAEHDQTRLSGRDTDPDYIRDLEHFPSLTHRQIHDRVQAMRPGDLHTAADTWISIADSIFGAVTTLHATVQTALTNDMSGHLADAATTAARRFVQDATDTAEITHSTGHRIIATAYAAEALRKSVPPPKTDGPAADRDEQYHLALAALDANYTPIYPPAGAGVPAYFTVMTPGVGISGGATDPAAAPTEGAAFTPQSAAPDGQVPGGFPGTRPQLSDPTASSTNAPVPQVIPGLRDADDTNSPIDQSTAADKTDRGPGQSPSHRSSNARPLDVETTPATTTSPDSPSRTATTPTADPTRTGRPPTPSPTVPRSRPFSPNPFPDPSRSYPGPTSPEPTTPARPLTTLDKPATAATTPPGMFAPGTRANQTPETSHHCPTWLVRDRQDELLGAALPHVAPILGAEFPSARNDPLQHSDDRSG